MIDEDDVEVLQSRRVLVPTRFIRQAYEHAQVTKDRHVVFMFVGEGSDMVCVGVSTRSPQRLIAGPPRQTETMLDLPEEAEWTIRTLTDEVIFEVISENAPIDTQKIGDKLGIAGSNIQLRQRIRRALHSLTEAKLVQKTGDERRPIYIPSQSQKIRKSEKTRTPIDPELKDLRKTVTAERVLQQLQSVNEPISAKTIGDMLGIPRSASLVRTKISTHLKPMIETGHVQSFGSGPGAKTYMFNRQRSGESNDQERDEYRDQETAGE